jgi:hypothetical protein
MDGGNEDRGFSLMKSLIKGHGREKRLGYTGLDNVGSSTSHNPIDSFTLRRRSVLPVRYELDCKYCYK